MDWQLLVNARKRKLFGVQGRLWCLQTASVFSFLYSEGQNELFGNWSRGKNVAAKVSRRRRRRRREVS
jgi:hypothetical protein